LGLNKSTDETTRNPPMIKSTFAILSAVLLMLPLGLQASDDSQHWEYKGEQGPEHWGEISPDFDICSRGRNQSPIDLVADFTADLPEVSFNYIHPGHLKEQNTGHAIQENVSPGNFIEIMDQEFELKQFHFHSPSEHTVNGSHLPMEVHFVHQNEFGDYVVVGVLFEQGIHNERMDRLPSFRLERGEELTGDPINFNELIPDRSDYFLYNGSLTTPPCSEGVQWIVLKQPIIASAAQIQHYHDLLGFDNNRPIQPKNSRPILEK
jgi:carbonic anhydrase